MDEEQDWGDLVNADWLRQHGIAPDSKTGLHTRETSEGSASIDINARGKICSAQVKNQSILAMLATNGLIDNYLVDFALNFLDMKRCFYRKTGYRVASLIVPDGMTGESPEILETLYIVVRRTMRGMQERLILESLYNPADLMDIVLVQAPPVQGRALNEYVRALEELPRIMREASDSVKDRVEKESACAQALDRVVY